MEHYINLQLQQSEATRKKIREQFAKLALRYHPDTSTEANATDTFQKIATSYKILSDVETKRDYDAWLLTQKTPRGPLTKDPGQAFAQQDPSRYVDEKAQQYASMRRQFNSSQSSQLSQKQYYDERDPRWLREKEQVRQQHKKATDQHEHRSQQASSETARFALAFLLILGYAVVSVRSLG